MNEVLVLCRKKKRYKKLNMKVFDSFHNNHTPSMSQVEEYCRTIDAKGKSRK